MPINLEQAERYVADQLDGEELVNFELDLLDDNELQNAVTLLRALRHRLESEPQISRTATYYKPLALAASILLTVSLGFNFIPAMNEEPELGFVGSVYYVSDQFRGGASDVEPIGPLEHRVVSLISVRVSSAVHSYSAIIKQNNVQVTPLTSVIADSEQSLNILVPPLESGVYVLEIVAPDYAKEIPFNVAEG